MQGREKIESVQAIISDIGAMAVGFSAGVDSTLLLKMAHDVLGDRVVAITCVSPTLPRAEREEAIRLARWIGVAHKFVASGEMEEPQFLANSNRRCYFCKSELFRILREEANALGLGAIAYGAQRDDLGEFRPGMEAARQYGARAPLLEAGLGKEAIRALSRAFGLPTWDKPAMACLSSRIPHGTPITAEDLARVERAEEAVRGLGFRLFRVRAMGERARVEVAREELPRLTDSALLAELILIVKRAGYDTVTVDPGGYRPGGGTVFGPPPGGGG